MTREQLMEALRCRVRPVEVTGRGTFYLRDLDGHGRAAWFRHVLSRTDDQGKVTDWNGFREELVRLTLCDESGALLFPDEKDRDALGGLDATAIGELFGAAVANNQLGREDAEKIGASFPK